MREYCSGDIKVSLECYLLTVFPNATSPRCCVWLPIVKGHKGRLGEDCRTCRHLCVYVHFKKMCRHTHTHIHIYIYIDSARQNSESPSQFVISRPGVPKATGHDSVVLRKPQHPNVIAFSHVASQDIPEHFGFREPRLPKTIDSFEDGEHGHAFALGESAMFVQKAGGEGVFFGLEATLV